MKKEIQITVPKDWSAVTLKQYLALQKDLKTYGDEEEARIACLFHHLCNFPPALINKIDTETFTKIKNDLINFIGNTEIPLQRFITIGGVKYGFEPNLSKMSYGAYLDITKYDDLSIDSNWANAMSILYRPVTNEVGKLYDIEPYDGTLNSEPFYDITMDVHLGTLFFFINLLKDLASYTLKSMTDMEEIPQDIKSILEKSGNLTLQSFNSPITI
jgi:hypothetical protein